MSGPLDGIKVIDMSAVISGPMACQVLCDQGAEVIKVEPLGMGDITRIGGFALEIYLRCTHLLIVVNGQ